ncbi:MAG: SPOR domain-containing protein [Salinivirgaceae bacterium]|nr:SPOR domain-containing protein [Salinivirgaceae bacterium]
MFAKSGMVFLVFMFVSIYAIGQINENDSGHVIHDIFTEINDNSYGGVIEIYQDPSLHVLIDRSERINKKEGLSGYRIQMFSGSGQDAREEARELSIKFIELFPDFDARLMYPEYNAPFFKLRLGDYRTKNEAMEFYHQLKKQFPNSYIVKSKINFPKLEANK